jgi:site-specific DNA-methyltransferase (adenine-specific)
MTDKLTLHHGDCLEVLRSLPDCSVDSVVTDPPYGLSFMGKRWDYDVPSVEVWAECLRVLKPGGHLLAFAGTRTQHRMAVRIEDAGFEIRDMIAWVYGSGFPKSLDVSKAIDKAAGAEREVVGQHGAPAKSIYSQGKQELPQEVNITAPATPEAKQWEGWGTALKPALEPITVARKPLIGTVAENVLQHGTGAINVDGGRVGTEELANPSGISNAMGGVTIGKYQGGNQDYSGSGATNPLGRWPANFIHDGSEEVVGLFPQTTSGAKKPNHKRIGGYGGDRPKQVYGTYKQIPCDYPSDSGSAARFFYCAKASKADRGENHHPTVKPTDLMRYLCRLVTPPSGIVLDPFMGSGSTGKAAMLEGFAFVGIEREAEYINIAKARIQSAVGLL